MIKFNSHKFNLFLGVLFALFSLSLSAEDLKLNVDGAINTALKNNREIKLALMDIQKAEAAVDEAYGYALPSIDFSTSFSHFIEKSKMPFIDFEALLKNATLLTLASKDVNLMDSAKAHSLLVPMNPKLQSFTPSNNYEAKITLTQILFNSAVLKGIGTSGIYLNLSRIALQSQISKTVMGAKQSFYQALLAREMFKITEAGYNNFEKNVNNLKLVYEQGLISELDYLQVKVQLENFRPRVKQAENAYQLSLEALKMTLGIEKTSNLEIEGEFIPEDINVPEFNQLIESIYNQNLDLKLLDHKKQVDEAMVELNRSEYYPTIAAFGNYTMAGSADNFNFMNYQSSIVGLSFSINLFNGGRTTKKVAQQLIGVEKTEEQIKAVKEGLAINAKSIVLNLERLKSALISAKENVNLATRANNIASIKLKEGAGRQLDYLNSEQAMREANLNYLVAINEYYTSKFNLENLLGKVNPDYLKLYEKELRK